MKYIFGNFLSPLFIGVIAATTPGLYLGKIIPVGSGPWFWILTILYVLVVIFILSFPAREIFRKLTLLIVAKDRSVFVFGVVSIFWLVVGFIFSIFVLKFIGKEVLASAKRDVLKAGYQFYLPPKCQTLSDDENAVCLFNEAWNAPSMRKFGTTKPIFDKPPIGRFEENTKKYKVESNKGDLSKTEFWNKKTEYEFLADFNNDAIRDRLTPKEKQYARQLLKEHRDAFMWMDRAFEVKNVDWAIERHLYAPFETPMPNMANYLLMAKLLLCRGLIRASDGKSSDAIKSFKTAIFLGDMCGKEEDLIGVMLDSAILRLITPYIGIVVPRLQSKGYDCSAILSFLSAKEMEDVFFESMEYEMLTRSLFMEKIRDVFYPFVLFDEAALLETNIALMNDLERPRDYENELKEFKWKGWFLGRLAEPNFLQMREKINEASTNCSLAILKVELGSYWQKHGCWPSDLELAQREFGSDPKLKNSFPSVKVTGAFVYNSKNPSGNIVTMVSRGEVPEGSGTGWLYDSSLGRVFVNSTIHDSQNVAYSFYGFK